MAIRNPCGARAARSLWDRKETDCHVGLCPPRNDVVIWRLVLLYSLSGHPHPIGGLFKNRPCIKKKCRKRGISVSYRLTDLALSKPWG